MKIYVASSLENVEAVKRFHAVLASAGHTVTYDWTVHGPVFKPALPRDVNDAAMRVVADLEIRGVLAADAVVVLLPGGRGTHVELGAALARGLPVAVAGAEEEGVERRVPVDPEHPLRDRAEILPFRWPCAFHYHHGVLGIYEPDEAARFARVLRGLA